MLNRRQFATLGTATAASLLTQRLWAQQARKDPNKFYFALVADSHIIDDFYVKGSENGVEDNESILLTTPRLVSARDLINSLNPAIEQVFLIGDYFHNYPSTDYDFYFKNTTRLDHAKTITDGFKMPVHLGFGNHDYDVHRVPREMSNRLFKAKFNAEPYSVLDYKGYKFIHLNNFLGSTQDNTAADFDPRRGSLGETQLHWFEAQLQQHKPTFVFIHYPLDLDQPTEFADYGLYPLLQKYKDTIQLVVSGHKHKWIDSAHTYGPQHYTMAATRYDPNAYMLMEVDTKANTWRFMNESLVEWSTHYAKPYRA
ncbi:metallophosphoesterase family protein [Granulicella tundricola]|uniref:Metallophosphoesterase n=1 Tax=Granulicella tundricola (strain ATCC BAA-1859 / DSM 23138 / MP5ACTX9) TaxID=1198114 RepID=E8X3J6_GRATM|nr:metallophosphoesterase [Granulicella tundricola]ADW68187.1 metallophosphoesterase [Granulicella tundricola MP5ACTX9]